MLPGTSDSEERECGRVSISFACLKLSNLDGQRFFVRVPVVKPLQSFFSL